MENRRQLYRHEFALTSHFAVRLHSVDNALVLHAELINLSIGGMYVYAPALRTHDLDQWLATLSLEIGVEPLVVPAERVHPPDGSEACWGFRFVDVDAPTTKAREKAIGKFLLEEQRRRWRLMHDERPDDGPLSLRFPADAR